MEILLQLHLHGMQLAPSPVKRDFNTWADELTTCSPPLSPRPPPDGTVLLLCPILGSRRSRTTGAWGAEGLDPIWNSFGLNLRPKGLGVGSHTNPPYKTVCLLAWFLVCHFHADV